jgi:hypothetical protein
VAPQSNLDLDALRGRRQLRPEIPATLDIVGVHAGGPIGLYVPRQLARIAQNIRTQVFDLAFNRCAHLEADQAMKLHLPAGEKANRAI